MSITYDIEWREVAATPLIASSSGLVSGTGPWTSSFANPEADLILISVHCRAATVSAVTFGGVSATLIASAPTDWPQTYIFAIDGASAPAFGQSHDVVATVTASSIEGAITVNHFAGTDFNLLSPNTAVRDDSTARTSTSLSITVGSAPSVVFDAITVREGCLNLAATGAGQQELENACFASPRGYGTSLLDAPTNASYTMSWSWVTSGRNRHCVVEIPLLAVAQGSDTGIVNTYYDLAGLDPLTTYEWRVRIDDTGAKLDWSDWFQFQTLETPLNSVGDLDIKEIGGDAISIQGGVAVSGSLSYKEINSDILDFLGSVEVGGELSISETGIDLFDAEGEVPLWVIPPDDVHWDQVTTSSMRLNWTPTDNCIG